MDARKLLDLYLCFTFVALCKSINDDNTQYDEYFMLGFIETETCSMKIPKLCFAKRLKKSSEIW